MTVYALILAGGRGSRLGGVRKGALRIGGQSLLDRVSAHFRDMPLLVSTGPGGVMDMSLGNALPDSSSVSKGPMAGILAALAFLDGQAGTGDLLLTVAVDTPFLPSDYVERMTAVLEYDGEAAYASWGGDIYPTNAIYRISALSRCLASTTHTSPKRLLTDLDAESVDWTGHADANPFANLNTLSDLIALGQRARSLDK